LSVRAAAAASERIWINGERARRLDVRDRGFAYGDGLFETMRVRAHAVRLLETHLERLTIGCRRLGFPAPERRVLRREIAEAAGLRDEGVLKLILSRGVGGRGYRPPAEVHPTRVLLLGAAPAAPAASQIRGGVTLRVCRTPLGVNSRLAGLKTLNRLESVLARMEWRDPRIWEGLMLDADGHVVCGTMTNVFVRRARTLHTPLLDRCGVAGVMRRWVLSAAPGLRLRVKEVRMRLTDLADADELFLTNAVAGVVSVGLLRIGPQRLRPPSLAEAERLRARLALV
jgi:4-amino-4-deoxychorismate lyase